MSSHSRQLSSAEWALIDRILCKPEVDPWREKLKAQLAEATVTNRTSTGAGLYVDLSVTKAHQVDEGAPSLFLNSVVSPDESEGVDCLLYLSNGVVIYLEVVASGTSLVINEVVSWLSRKP